VAGLGWYPCGRLKHNWYVVVVVVVVVGKVYRRVA